MVRSVPDLAVLAGIFFIRIWPLRRTLSRSRFLLTVTVYLYFCGVWAATMLPVLWQLPHISMHPYTVNLLPFNDFLHGWGDTVRQIVLNVVMLIPFGLLVPRLTRRKFLHTMLLSVALMASIELLQPLFSRSCDITDLITNMIGCAIGYLIGLPLASPLAKLSLWLDEE